MVKFEYLAKGLYGMARAHRANTMAGHLGAAVVAGYFIGERNADLDEAVYAGIEGELDRIINGGSVFTPGSKAGVSVREMFEPFSKEPPQDDPTNSIAAALSKNIDETRQSGHNVIFAAIAIRALKGHPEYASPQIVEGIRKLIAGFDGVTPGNGYYGKEKGRIDGRKISLPADESLPPFADLTTMAEATIGELVEKGTQHRQGYGGLYHLINHAAALVELRQQGYAQLAVKGLPAMRQHLRLWRTLPEVSDDLGPVTAVKHEPLSAAYWTTGMLRRDSARLTHRIKTLYGFNTLIELIEDDQREQQARENLQYLM